jgi:RNA-directed DNA polymerase
MALQEKVGESVRALTPLNLFSVSHLQALVGHSFAELLDLSTHAVKYFSPFVLKPKPRPFARKVESKKPRLIDRPIDLLKAIQGRIDAGILKSLVLPEHLLGGVRGKSIVDNVERHRNARYLVTIDIKNFFPSITAQMVNCV